MKRFLPLCLVLMLACEGLADEKQAPLVGTWRCVSGMRAGKEVAKERLPRKVPVTKETITLPAGGGNKFVVGYKLNTKATPVTIDMVIKEGPEGVGSKALGIVALKGNQLTLCYHPEGKVRPKAFQSTKENGAFLFVLKRAK